MTNYQLKDQTITINQIDYLIRSLLDSQQFDDQKMAAAALGISSATWSLFGIVWPAAKVLADLVQAINLTGKRVLEIGCGIALSSIVLHRQGVNITASDYHPLTQEFLDRNILRNGLTPIKYLTGNWETENPLMGEFDFIIGSDILYQPAHIDDVSGFIDRHSSDDVKVLIVDPGRQNRAKFTHKMQSLGYDHRFESFDQIDNEQQHCEGQNFALPT